MVVDEVVVVVEGLVLAASADELDIADTIPNKSVKLAEWCWYTSVFLLVVQLVLLVVVVLVVVEEEEDADEDEMIVEVLLLLATESAPNSDLLRFRCAVRGGYVVDESKNVKCFKLATALRRQKTTSAHLFYILG